jgi:hypothetical protein
VDIYDLQPLRAIGGDGLLLLSLISNFRKFQLKIFIVSEREGVVIFVCQLFCRRLLRDFGNEKLKITYLLILMDSFTALFEDDRDWPCNQTVSDCSHYALHACARNFAKSDFFRR